MKTSAHPADTRAAPGLDTVKKRMITCGRPAVPNISAPVIAKTSIIDLLVWVYSRKPRSCTTVFSFSSIATSSPRTFEMNPSCGIGLPVMIREMKIAGTV